ncbi:hypothetical protein DFJ77DRAFT_451022 [Powellomyces hirtus]|nr:hypothetical protein DFJ77DRAFT_451022 [Powellomyces hirtus]
MISLPWALAAALKNELGIDLTWIFGGGTSTADSWLDPCKEAAGLPLPSVEVDSSSYDEDDEITVVTSSESIEWFDCDDGNITFQDLLEHSDILVRLLDYLPKLKYLSAQTWYHTLNRLPIDAAHAPYTRKLMLHPPETNNIWIGDIGDVLTHSPFLTTLHIAGTSGCVSNLLAKMLMDSCPLLTDLGVSLSDAITHGFLRSLRLRHLVKLTLKDLPGLPAQTALVLALENHPQLESLFILNLPASGEQPYPTQTPVTHSRLQLLDVSQSAISTTLIPSFTPNLRTLCIRRMPWQINLPPIVTAFPNLTLVDARGSRGHMASHRESCTVLMDPDAEPEAKARPAGGITTRLVRAFTM